MLDKCANCQIIRVFFFDIPECLLNPKIELGLCSRCNCPTWKIRSASHLYMAIGISPMPFTSQCTWCQKERQKDSRVLISFSIFVRTLISFMCPTENRESSRHFCRWFLISGIQTGVDERFCFLMELDASTVSSSMGKKCPLSQLQVKTMFWSLLVSCLH